MKTNFLLNEKLYRKYLRKNKGFSVDGEPPLHLYNWQMMRIVNEGITYISELCDEDYPSVVDTFVIPFEKISKIFYNEKTRMVVVCGDVEVTRNVNCLHQDGRCGFFGFLDCFDEKIIDILGKNEKLKDKIFSCKSQVSNKSFAQMLQLCDIRRWKGKH